VNPNSAEADLENTNIKSLFHFNSELGPKIKLSQPAGRSIDISIEGQRFKYTQALG
jgi:hypothetical protein